MSSMSESHWWYVFHKEVKSWDSTVWFRSCNFKPRLKSGIFECISWLNGSFFGGDDRGFLKEGVKTYLMAPMRPLNSPTFFLSLTSVVYVHDGLCFPAARIHPAWARSFSLWIQWTRVRRVVWRIFSSDTYRVLNIPHELICTLLAGGGKRAKTPCRNWSIRLLT